MPHFIELTNQNRDKVYVSVEKLVAFYRGAAHAHTSLVFVGGRPEAMDLIEHVAETPEQIQRKIAELPKT